VKRTSAAIAALAAGVLLLSACTSGETGSPSAGSTASTPASTTASPSESPSGSSGSSSTSSSSSSSSSTAGGSTDDSSPSGDTVSSGTTDSAPEEPTGDAVPAELDAPTQAWFAAFCTGLDPVVQLAQSGFDPGSLSETDLPTAVAGLTTAGAAFTATGAALAALPAPTFEGGAEVADTVVQGLNQGGGQMSASAAALGQVNPADQAAVDAAKEQASEDFTLSTAPFQNVADLDPEVQAALNQFPPCQNLSGG
jgi:hypothetical protein